MSFKRILVSLMTTLMLLASMPHASAQSTGGSGLSISPPRAILTISPGKADNIEVTLKNTSGVAIVARAEVDDFEADGLTGEPKIIVNSKAQSPASIKKFLVGVGDVQLAKDESKKFDIPVQVPANATSGAYYGVVRYTAQAVNKQEAANRQVALNASLGLIVLLQVPGNIKEQVQAQKISVSRNDSNASIFVAAPTGANVSLKNIGNGFSSPFGHVTVSKNGKQVYAYEMNNTDPRSTILPGSSRTFKDPIKNVSALGRYTIVANISYGTGGEILTLKTSFWVLPLWFVITLGVVILLALVVATLLYRGISKRRNRRR